jgi:PadR family transcriptional regulator PadR
MYYKIAEIRKMKKYLTRSEEILLLAIWRLKDYAYGVTVREKVKALTGKTMSFGALYVSLDKLAQKGYVIKQKGTPIPERGGRHKIYYSLTAYGKKALQRARELNEILWDDVPEMAFKS